VDSDSRWLVAQYESNPYPGWTSIPIRPEAQRSLRAYFSPNDDVLIAGCGPGQQAIQASRCVRIKCKGAHYRFVSGQPGLHGADGKALWRPEYRLRAGRSAGASDSQKGPSRFAVIECAGVLHHMTDPFVGWRSLIGCLGPDGRMLLGLYSSLGRRNLAALRSHPAYPGH
jgi:SAM-dependent methyltransferase